MAIKPILFNTEMVEAILSCRKTQTRRIIKPQPSNPRWNNIGWLGWDDGHGYRMKSPCEPGDILWVRETWRPAKGAMHELIWGRLVESNNWHDGFEYKDGFYHFPDGFEESGDLSHLSEIRSIGKWHPSIHMPKEAARIFLLVKDVRLEKLNDILAHAGEVAKEGIPYSDEGDIEASGLRFKELWDSTINQADLGEYGWYANPWVWVIEFERCDKPEGWC